MSHDRELDQVKAPLAALAESLPTLIDTVRAHAVGQLHTTAVDALPDAQQQRQRLTSFAAYLDRYRGNDGNIVGPLQLQQVLADAAELARGEIETKASLHTNYLTAPLVCGNVRQLGQVFVSLLINAAQACAADRRDTNHISVELDTTDAGWARIAIADTGCGIAADVLPHIFAPLYSTKHGAGMGLGLALVHQIITSFGGRVTAESTVGFGTLFIVELPPAS